MNDSDAIDLLQALVGIPSPSGQERPAADWLAGWLGAYGFDATVDAAGNAVGRRGSGARRILLLSHIDTFPGTPPVQRVGDWLTGRGTVDAKGSLCAFAFAAAAVAVLPDWQITVVGAVEEETASSQGARHLLAHDPAPEFCIIGEPSGWERVTLGYKGRLMVDLHWRAPFSHSAGRERLPAEQAVTIWNAVVAHCEALNVGRTTAFDRIDPSLRHIATRDDGAYCIVDMTIGFRLPLHLNPQALAAQVGPLADAAVPKVVPLWAMDETTESPAPVPHAVRGAPVPHAVRGAQGTAPTPAGFETRRGRSTQDSEALPVDRLVFSAPEVAFRADKNNPLVRAWLAGIRATGGQPRFVLKTGTSDMNVVGPVWNVPIIAYGPGDSALDHTPEERISLDEYRRSIRVIRNALEILQGSKA